MAYVDPNKAQKFDHPTEPGQWIRMRPMRGDDLEADSLVEVKAGKITKTLDILPRVIVEWSYDEPIDREHVGGQDIDTIGWFNDCLNKASGIVGEAEKKDSSSGSSESDSIPAPRNTRRSSPISVSANGSGDTA